MNGWSSVGTQLQNLTTSANHDVLDKIIDIEHMRRNVTKKYAEYITK